MTSERSAPSDVAVLHALIERMRVDRERLEAANNRIMSELRLARIKREHYACQS